MGRYAGLILLSLCALFGAAVPNRAGATAQLPITIKVSGAIVPGSPVPITWSLTNTTASVLLGSMLYYVDQNPVSPVNLPNTLSIPPGHSLSGTFAFPAPGPGSHLIGLSLLDRIHAGPSTTHTPARLLTPGAAPVDAPAVTPAPSAVTVLASGFKRIYTSQTSTALPAGLTESLKYQFLQKYAPLLLFSYDHDSEEEYAPIDVLDFVKASSLVSNESDIQGLSNAALVANPQAILDPAPASTDPTVKDAGTINPNQPIVNPPSETRGLPRQIYLSPSSAAEQGTGWDTVMKLGHVGLYGHVQLLTLPVANPAQNGHRHPERVPMTAIAAELYSRYHCVVGTTSCPAEVIKIEYWQFFGYSHDFQNPAAPFTNLLGPQTDTYLADLIDHSGDWCSVQLYIDAGWALSPNPDKAILVIDHYAHGLQFRFDMAQVQMPLPSPATVQGYAVQELRGPFYGQPVEIPYGSGQTDSGVQAAQNNVVQLAQAQGSPLFVHPVVYVEWGGHEFFPTSGWDYTLASNHNGQGKYHYIAQDIPDIGPVALPQGLLPNPAETASSIQGTLITKFAGFWGYYGPGNRNKPPPGPPLHAEWLWDPGTPPGLAKVVPDKLPQ